MAVRKVRTRPLKIVFVDLQSLLNKEIVAFNNLNIPFGKQFSFIESTLLSNIPNTF